MKLHKSKGPITVRFLKPALLFLLLGSASAQAEVSYPVTFECTGQVTQVSRGESRSLTAIAHVRGFIDGQDLSTRQFSGVLTVSPGGRESNLVERGYAIERCQGEGMITLDDDQKTVSAFSLHATEARVWIARGNQSPIRVGVSTTMSGTPDGYQITVLGVQTSMAGTPEG